jgi:hypothetical protein
MTQEDAQENGIAAQRPDCAGQGCSLEKPEELEDRCTLDAQSDSADNQMACIKHAIVVREHTASWLGVAVIGGYIAINGFVCVKAVFMASTETDLIQILERLNMNFGSAIGFVLGYYFATKANGLSNGSRDSRKR